MLQVCETIYGCERGAEISAFLETAMGHACPCKAGSPCPLMPPAPRSVEVVEPVA